MSRIVIGFFLIGFLQSASCFGQGDRCPPPEDIMPCRCRGRNEQIQVWCNHSDLERVNGALENLMRLRSMPAIDELIVENNKMPTLPARAFGALRIGRLLLRNNGLESISRNAFAGLENSLEEIYIVEETLHDFPFDSIEQLRNLEAFTIERSKIRLLPKFSGLNRLKHIRIDGSGIGGLPVGAFAKMAAIKQIHVVNSNLVTLPDGIFGPLDTLQLANFSRNQISSIQRRSFARLPKLEVLSIAQNRLQDAVSVGRACEELSALKSLDLSGNQFKILPEGSFVHLRSLQMLNLAGNGIESVSPRSFTHLPALRRVDLTQNQLRNFPKLLFDSSPLLEEISMRKNLLSTGNEIGELLNSLKSLRFLDLGENGVTTLPSGTIADHSQLQKVDLSDNLIGRIERDAFRNVPSLVELSLRNNSLIEMPSVEADTWRIPSLALLDVSSNKIQNLGLPAFIGLPALTRLDLSYNRIKAIGSSVFGGNSNLEELELIGNGVSSVAFNSFTGLGKLRHLDLSRNHLELIQSGTFRDLGKLQVLNLGNNRINNVPSDILNTLRALEELSLKSNLLNHVPPGLFVALENLKELNLKQNAITQLGRRLFSDLKNLRALKLSSNQITIIDETALDELQKLKSLDLSSNRITYLSSRLLKNLIALEKFDARENRITLLENGAFEHAAKLQMVDLAQNALERIPDFVKSASLRVADFSHNQIRRVDAHAFTGSKSLMELYLNDNKLTQIEAQTFNNLGLLTILDLDENELTEIRGDAFQNLPRLIYLRLSRNKIRVINNGAFLSLPALDGIDLQENELESIGEGAFERTASLKYLNLSHNNFDDMSRMGLFPLQSLEVLDISFNRLVLFDDKALRHLQWLVELRVNDNGICALPIGVFDGMRRLKMLILKNNSISHFYESVFHKLKSNVAFLDFSGNPIVCDCELIWFRNLMTREAFRELSEATCEAPNDLRGQMIKNLRPGRMVCSNANANKNVLRGIGISKYDQLSSCPTMTISKRKPRPVSPDPSQKPVFADTSPGVNEEVDAESGTNELKNNRRNNKDEKILSHDYIPGDSPTIYAGSMPRPNQVSGGDGKLSSGLSALSNLFGIPIPSLDFGLNLGISPSVSVTDKQDTRVQEDERQGFPPAFKGQDPLPPSWLDRPSKGEQLSPVAYEPPEYIPRKPVQPYIPLNPYANAESNTLPSVLPPKSGGKSKSSPRWSVTSLPKTSWHPSYPTVETGFIPIEPFFHSAVVGRGSGSKQQNKTKSEGLSSSRPNLYYQTLSRRPNTTPLYSDDVSTQRNELYTPTEVPFPGTSLPPLDEFAGVQSESDGVVASENDDEGDTLSDFWGMFSSRNTSRDSIPLDFSAPIDTEPNSNSNFPSTTFSPPAEASELGESFHENPYQTPTPTSHHQVVPDSSNSRKFKGKSTITKVKLDENPQGSSGRGGGLNGNPSTNAFVYSNEPHGNSLGGEAVRKSPPVLIGGADDEPLDWYYRNYNVQPNPEEEIEKYLDRSRVNTMDDRLVGSASGAKHFSEYSQCSTLLFSLVLFLL